MYDFHKLRHDSEENEWRHKLFRRGHPNQLSEIKRKINDTQVQEAVVTQKEQKKISSDTQYLLKEMGGMKQKQDSLEKACSVLIAQNTQILNENKLLWGEIKKKKEKQSRKVEKLFSLFLTYIGPNKMSEIGGYNKTNNGYLKQEDMSGDDDDDDEENDVFNNRQLGNGMLSQQQQQQQQQQLRQNQRGGFTMNRSNKQQWDIDEINNSLNNYPFNNNNNNNNTIMNGNALLNCSLNGQPLNSSIEKGVTGNSGMNMESGDQLNIAKFMEGMKKNLMLKHDQQQQQQNQQQQQQQQQSSSQQQIQQNSNLKSEHLSSQSSSVKNIQSQYLLQQQQGSQVSSAVDTFHRSNQDLLMQLSHFVSNNHPGSGVPNFSGFASVSAANNANGNAAGGDFNDGQNNNSTSVGVAGTSDSILKRPLKKVISTNFNPNPFHSTDFDFQSILEQQPNNNEKNINKNNLNESVVMSKPVKKFKKDDDENLSSLNINNSTNLRMMNASRFTPLNTAQAGPGNSSLFQNHFSLEDLIMNTNQGGSTREFNMDILNQRNSIDFSKFLTGTGTGGGGGQSSIALPFSVTPNNNNNNNQNEQKIDQVSKQKLLPLMPSTNLNDSNLAGFVNNNKQTTTTTTQNTNTSNIKKKNIITTANTGSVMLNPHMKSSQWEEFNQFLNEQKIETTPNQNGSLANSLIGDSLPIIPRKVTQISNAPSSLNNSLL